MVLGTPAPPSFIIKNPILEFLLVRENLEKVERCFRGLRTKIFQIQIENDIQQLLKLYIAIEASRLAFE